MSHNSAYYCLLLPTNAYHMHRSPSSNTIGIWDMGYGLLRAAFIMSTHIWRAPMVFNSLPLFLLLFFNRKPENNKQFAQCWHRLSPNHSELSSPLLAEVFSANAFRVYARHLTNTTQEYGRSRPSLLSSTHVKRCALIDAPMICFADNWIEIVMSSD